MIVAALRNPGEMAGTRIENFKSADGTLARAIPQYVSDRFSNVSCHSSSSSVPQQSGAGDDDMHSPTSGRISPTDAVPTKAEVRKKLADALKLAASSAKPIARASGASVDTAEGWRNEINIPGGYNLIVLARQLPEVRAVVRQLIDCDFDQDPRAYSMFIEAMRYAQGRGK